MLTFCRHEARHKRTFVSGGDGDSDGNDVTCEAHGMSGAARLACTQRATIFSRDSRRATRGREAICQATLGRRHGARRQGAISKIALDDDAAGDVIDASCSRAWTARLVLSATASSLPLRSLMGPTEIFSSSPLTPVCNKRRVLCRILRISQIRLYFS